MVLLSYHLHTVSADYQADSYGNDNPRSAESVYAVLSYEDRSGYEFRVNRGCLGFHSRPEVTGDAISNGPCLNTNLRNMTGWTDRPLVTETCPT